MDHKEVYSQTIGFSSSVGGRRIPPQDIYLFNNTNQWMEFKKTYLWDLPIPDPNDNQIFVYVQMDYSEADAHVVKDVRIINDKLEVTVKKFMGGGGSMSVVGGPNNIFKDVLIFSISSNLVINEVQLAPPFEC